MINGITSGLGGTSSSAINESGAPVGASNVSDDTMVDIGGQVVRLDHNGSAGADPTVRKRKGFPSSYTRVTVKGA